MIIKLEDNINYYITKEITEDNVVYVYLTNVNDVTDFCIRKTDLSREMLNGLDNEDELNHALELFNKNLS